MSCGCFRVSHSALMRGGGCTWPHKAGLGHPAPPQTGCGGHCPFSALMKAHVEVLAPACNFLVSTGLLGVMGDIPAALWECAQTPAIPASWCWQAWLCDRRLQQQKGLEPSRGLWPSCWLRAGPALKIKLQSFLFSQAWWLSSSATLPPFVQKCPCVKVLPQLLGHLQSDFAEQQDVSSTRPPWPL